MRLKRPSYTSGCCPAASVDPAVNLKCKTKRSKGSALPGLGPKATADQSIMSVVVSRADYGRHAATSRKECGSSLIAPAPLQLPAGVYE